MGQLILLLVVVRVPVFTLDVSLGASEPSPNGPDKGEHSKYSDLEALLSGQAESALRTKEADFLDHVDEIGRPVLPQSRHDGLLEGTQSVDHLLQTSRLERCHF